MPHFYYFHLLNLSVAHFRPLLKSLQLKNVVICLHALLGPCRVLCHNVDTAKTRVIPNHEPFLKLN